MKINLRNLKHFGEGVKNMSPAQMCDIRISSYYGMNLGLIIVFIGMLMSKSWGWAIFLFFFLIVQSTQLVNEYKTRDTLRELSKQMEQFKNLENVIPQQNEGEEIK